MSAFIWLGVFVFACLLSIVVLAWLAPDLTHPGVFVRRPDHTWGALGLWLVILVALLIAAFLCYVILSFVFTILISP